MNSRPPFLSAALALLVTATSGCSLFGPEDRTIEVTGRVVLAGTSEPIAQIDVVIECFRLTAFTCASTRTDAEGRFSLRYDAARDYAPGRLSPPYGYVVRVNAPPYDEGYTGGFSDGVFPGHSYDFGTIELERHGPESPPPGPQGAVSVE